MDFFCLYLFFHLIFLISIAGTLIYAYTNTNGQSIGLQDLPIFGNLGKKGGVLATNILDVFLKMSVLIIVVY